MHSLSWIDLLWFRSSSRRPPSEWRTGTGASNSAGNLAPLVLDQSIRAMMRDGTYFEGLVVKASPEGLTVRVRRTEPRSRLARPEAVIPAADLSVVRMKRNGSAAASITLGIIGGISGFVLGASCCGEAIPLSLLLASTTSVAGAVRGSLLGRELNRKTITIFVIDPGPWSSRVGSDKQEAAGPTEE